MLYGFCVKILLWSSLIACEFWKATWNSIRIDDCAFCNCFLWFQILFLCKVLSFVSFTEVLPSEISYTGCQEGRIVHWLPPCSSTPVEAIWVWLHARHYGKGQYQIWLSYCHSFNRSFSDLTIMKSQVVLTLQLMTAWIDLIIIGYWPFLLLTVV